MPDSTPALHEAAKHLPYRELVGSLMYPAVMTKLEMRYAISQLGRFMSNWTCEHWNLAIICLKYGCTTRWYGVICSYGLDKHGVNVLYAYAEGNFFDALPSLTICLTAHLVGWKCGIKQHSNVGPFCLRPLNRFADVQLPLRKRHDQP